MATCEIHWSILNCKIVKTSALLAFFVPIQCLKYPISMNRKFLKPTVLPIHTCITITYFTYYLKRILTQIQYFDAITIVNRMIEVSYLPLKILEFGRCHILFLLRLIDWQLMVRWGTDYSDTEVLGFTMVFSNVNILCFSIIKSGLILFMWSAQLSILTKGDPIYWILNLNLFSIPLIVKANVTIFVRECAP